MKIKVIQELISKMTLEEKASFCSGADFWHTQTLERLGIPATMVSDGPHGLRKQEAEGDNLGISESLKAICFPAGCGIAATFNRDLLERMGQALGNECQAEGISVLLGPAVNIKRSPLCGRNFEYLSEDPILTSEMAGSLIKGIQSKHVGACIKHFLANNQETRRMSSSSEIDERTLREIYLAAFEGAIVKQKPWTVMCSYNRINGVYAAENKTYLTDILRNEWEFDGYVMSDWGATNNRVRDLMAGMDLEMPDSHGINNGLIVEAVKCGELDESVVDTAVERILNIVYRYEENRDKCAVFDREKEHELARTVAHESIVLLKNEDILPLNEEDTIAFIGEFAKKPRYQGGGSSHINSYRVTSAMEAVAGNTKITYTQGYHTDKDLVDDKLMKEAVNAAKKSKVAVIFAGLPDVYESESYDREHMRIPDCQNELIEKITAVQPNTVVVLHNGSPVEMPWVNKVKGIVETYLSGEAVGEAVADILFGKVNPSGKLPESFPLRLEDNPSYLYYPGEGDKVEYKEGIFVGYRYYDKKKMEILFPFGHGCSYTTFEYSNMKLSKTSMKDTDTVLVSVDVKNTGKRIGKEIVQLYVSDQESMVNRPEKELKDFAKVELKPGETKTVTFKLEKRAFAYFNTTIHDWHVESGAFDILIGKSSRDIQLQKTIMVESTVRIPFIFTKDTIFGDIFHNEKAMEIVKPLINMDIFGDLNNDKSDSNFELLKDKTKYMPLRTVLNFSSGYTMEDLNRIVECLNNEANGM